MAFDNLTIPTFHFPAESTFSDVYHGTHKPSEQPLSIMPPILLRHLSLTFYWAAHQPQYVETQTCHHTCIRIQICGSCTREGARSHTTVLCTFLQGNVYTVFCLSILKWEGGSPSICRPLPLDMLGGYWAGRRLRLIVFWGKGARILCSILGQGASHPHCFAKRLLRDCCVFLQLDDVTVRSGCDGKHGTKTRR